MDSQVTFEQIEETAIKFALAMGQDNLNDMLNVSNLTMGYAIEWHKLQPTRLCLFYSDPENRKNWIKASDSKISVSDVGTGTLQKENSYWIIPRHADCPVFAKLTSFDGPDAEFEAPENKGSYYAKEILVGNQPRQTTEDVPPASIPTINNYW